MNSHLSKKQLQLISKVTVCFLLVVIIGCSPNSQEKFDAMVWQQKSGDWWMTDAREKMVDDLISSDTLIDLHASEMRNLLGEPAESGQTVRYLIREKYSSDIDPDYISYLIIEWNNEKRVTNCYISKN